MGCLFFKSGYDKMPFDKIPQDLWNIQLENLYGGYKCLGEFRINKKAFLIVNVASCWGLTSTNYSQLVELYKNHKDEGLEILAFPSTQFMNQEKKTNEEIIEFLKENEVTFPVFTKTIVNGPDTHPLYVYLKVKSPLNNGSKGLKNIPWNFGKFLMDVNGNNVQFFPPTTKPREIENEIVKLLKV